MSTMPTPHARPGWQFWLEWMGMSVGGLALYIILMIPLNILFAAFRPPIPGEPMNPWLAVLISSIGSLSLGLVLGAAQWLVLRKHIEHVGGWVLATALGYALPLINPLRLPDLNPAWLNGVVMLLTFGVILGVLQWLVLRNHIANAGWWIPISIGGWLLAFALTGAAYAAHLYVEPFDMIAAGLVPIAVAGAGLVWIFSR